MIRPSAMIASGPAYRPIHRGNVAREPFWRDLDPELRDAIEIVSLVLPFRTNRYVTDELIDWSRVPDDPLYQLNFPQPGMLDDAFMRRLRRCRETCEHDRLQRAIARIRDELNPHPAGQLTHNGASLDGGTLPGVQHKYRETVLFFPAQGQTCHAYCTFCFRWPQFVGDRSLRMATRESTLLARYLRRHPAVTDVIITGGDPMVMAAPVLERYLAPLLRVPSLTTIRIGTKAPAYWPHRFTTDADADDLLRVLERVVESGRHLAIMTHLSHPVELSTETSRHAVRRLRSTGAVVRMQSPVARRINDDSATWAELWRTGVQLGCVPYYMFVLRDTGPRHYFELPLARCWEIYRDAYAGVSGLARTVRGPSMSCLPGKCHILGTTAIGDERVFVLEFLQARRPELVRRPFLARFDPEATWFDDLEPLRRSDAPFFGPARTALYSRGRHRI